MHKDLLVHGSRLRVTGTCGDPGPSHRLPFTPCGSWRHAQGKFEVFREVCRSRDVLLRARKGRSSGNGAPRRQHTQEASVPPRLPEEVVEPLRNPHEAVHAPAALNEELMECQSVTEILDIVTEEAAIMTGANASLALMRLVNLSKSQLQQLRSRPECTKFLSVLEQHIHELGPKELAQSLWSLAKAKYNRPKLLRRLADHACLLLADFNERDMSTVVWAFGSLQYNPGKALLDGIAAAASARLHEFQPQGISMLTWGYGKLDHAPAGDLLDQIAHALELDVSVYRHQAVANMFYSFARLQKDSPTLCAAVETHVTDHAEDFSPQELMNILWAFVKFRFVPKQFIAALLEYVLDEDRARTFRSSDWAALIWGLASLGVSVPAEPMAAINKAGLQHLPSMTAPELCNVMWGLSILDECNQPIFVESMSQLLENKQQTVLEPRLLRQLLQASALAQAADVSVSLPEPVHKAAAKWWRATANTVPSLTHDGVSRTLKNLGVKHRVLVFLQEGLPTVDIALEAWGDQPKVAIQVVGPHEVSTNTNTLLGRATAEARLLSASGWRPFHVVVSTFSDPASQQTRKIVSQLQKQGLQVRVPEGVRPGVQGMQRVNSGRNAGTSPEVSAKSGSLSSSEDTQLPLVIGLHNSRDSFSGTGGPTAMAEPRVPLGTSDSGLLSLARY